MTLNQYQRHDNRSDGDGEAAPRSTILNAPALSITRHDNVISTYKYREWSHLIQIQTCTGGILSHLTALHVSGASEERLEKLVLLKQVPER